MLTTRIPYAIIFSSFLARFVSSLVNYYLNKYFVFKYKKEDKKAIFKYFLFITLDEICITATTIVAIPYNPPNIILKYSSILFIYHLFNNQYHHIQNCFIHYINFFLYSQYFGKTLYYITKFDILNLYYILSSFLLFSISYFVNLIVIFVTLEK